MFSNCSTATTATHSPSRFTTVVEWDFFDYVIDAVSACVDKESTKDALIQGSLGGNQKMTIINELGLAQTDGAFVQFKSME